MASPDRGAEPTILRVFELKEFLVSTGSIGGQVIARRRPAVRVGHYNHMDYVRALAAMSMVTLFVSIEFISVSLGFTRHFGDLTRSAVHFVGTVNVLIAMGAVVLIALVTFLVRRFPVSDAACAALTREDR